MAGKSHNYTMNLSIKAQADGIGKTNSEITQLNNEVKRLDGKKIDLKISLGSKLGKEIDSLVKSIGNIEKSLNSISSKGLQGLEQAIGSVGKSTDATASAIGSLQKSVDGISARGIQSLEQAESSAIKGAEDLASAMGHVQTASDSISGKGLENLQMNVSKTEDAVTDLASQMEKLSTTSGLSDNWNNSYGGRYGGMRYTGQGKGLNDLVSFIGGGKTSAELTYENAMSKTRNMAVAKSWIPEGGVTGFDAYWELDEATNKSLMSLNKLGAATNAWAATSGASAKDIANHAQHLADFGTMVIGLGYTEDVAETAVMKLARGLHGTFAALDQYGITKESLVSTGKWNGDESDLDGYMEAVSEYSQRMSQQLMNTPTGQMATLSKSASLGGYALGQIEAEMMTSAVSGYKYWDDRIRSLTKNMGIGATVRDNMGNAIYRKPEEYERDDKGNILYDDNGNPKVKKWKKYWAKDEYDQNGKKTGTGLYTQGENGEEVRVESLEEGLAEGFQEEKTGFSLSSAIILAEQATSAYRTLKDTVLGTFAEIRDFRRIRQVGLRNIFKGDDYQYIDGKLVKTQMADACNEASKGCPATGGKGGSDKGKNKRKKRSRIGRLRDKIGRKFNSSISNPDFKGYTSSIGPEKAQNKKTPSEKHKTKLAKEHGYKKTNKRGDYNLKNAVEGLNLLDTIDSGRKDKGKRKEYKGKIEDTVPKMKGGKTISESEGIKKGNRRTSKDVGTGPKIKSNIQKIWNKLSRELEETGQISSKSRIADFTGQSLGSRSDLPNMKTGHIDESKNKKITHGESQGVKKRLKNADLKGAIENTQQMGKKRPAWQTRATLNEKRNAEKQAQRDKTKPTFGKTQNKVGYSTRKNLDKVRKNDLAKRDSKRNQYVNKYGGYQKRTLGAIYDVGQLKNKASKYINAKKKLVSREWNLGKWVADRNSKSWGKKGRQLPYTAWDKAKSGARSAYGALPFSDQTRSTLSNAYGSLAMQGSFLKNGVKNSRAWGAMSKVGGEIKGNASAFGQMTGFTPWFNQTKVGKGVQSVKEKGVKSTVGKGASKVAGGMKSIGGSALSTASKGIGTMASGLGKVSGLVSGIGMGFLSILGPIGAVIGGVTLLLGILDMLGVDLSPLQEAFGGFIDAMKPAIQGLNEWISGVAKELGPILTQVGQVLGPVLQTIGSLLAGGLGALASILGPIIDGLGKIFGGEGGIGSLFDSLKNGAEGLKPLADTISQLMQLGADNAGQFIGHALDGIGEYLKHVVAEAGTAFGQFWINLGNGMSTAITTVGTSVTTAIDALKASVVALINGIGFAIGSQITALGNAIVIGLSAISLAIVESFNGFAQVVLQATGDAYWAILQFQGQAVQAMKDTATQMVDGFTSNFTGIADAVDAEMSGAYSSLCYWGDLMIAKAEEIGAKMSEAYQYKGVNMGSPGNIWRATIAEMKGTYGALVSSGHGLIRQGYIIGRNLTRAYIESYNQDILNQQPEIPTSTSSPQYEPYDVNITPVPVTPPQFTEPKMFKEMKKQNQTEPVTNVYNFNHHGYIGSEELGKTAMDYFAEKINFENKKANRSV